MIERPKNAWLITWEDGPAHERALSRPKVVSILPFRTPAKMVEEVVRALFVSDYPLSLGEKFHFGLHAEQRRLCMLREVGECFLYGSHERLYARKVKNLRRKVGKDGTESLSWTEFPRFKIDRETMRPVMIVAERDNSWSDTPNEKEG